MNNDRNELAVLYQRMLDLGRRDRTGVDFSAAKAAFKQKLNEIAQRKAEAKQTV